MNSIVFESITSCQESVTIIFLDFQWIKHKGFKKKFPLCNVLIMHSDEKMFLNHCELNNHNTF